MYGLVCAWLFLLLNISVAQLILFPTYKLVYNIRCPQSSQNWPEVSLLSSLTCCTVPFLPPAAAPPVIRFFAM